MFLVKCVSDRFSLVLLGPFVPFPPGFPGQRLKGSPFWAMSRFNDGTRIPGFAFFDFFWGDLLGVIFLFFWG